MGIAKRGTLRVRNGECSQRAGFTLVEILVGMMVSTLIIGAAYKSILALAKLWPGVVDVHLPVLAKGVIGIKPTPALMGVGYVLIVRPTFTDSIVRQLNRLGEDAFVLGKIVKGKGNVRLE